MKSKILSWLTDPKRTAEDGRMLYAQYGRKQFISRQINRLQNDKKVIAILDTQFRLMLGMSVLPPQVDPVVVKKEDPKRKASKVISANGSKKSGLGKIKSVEPKKRELADPYPDEDTRPEELKELYKQKNELYVEAKNLNSTLIAKGDEMDKYDEGSTDYIAIADVRREMAKEIIEKYNEVNMIWKKIDYFKEHGKLPEAEMLETKIDVKADVEDPIALDKRWRTIGTYISKAKKNPERNQEKLSELYAESNQIAEKLNALSGENKYVKREHEAATESK